MVNYENLFQIKYFIGTNKMNPSIVPVFIIIHMHCGYPFIYNY